MKCLEYSMHSTSSAGVIIIYFHKWDNWSSKGEKTKLYPHSPFYHQIHCQGRTLPYIPIHKASGLHSTKLLAFGRLRKQVWEQGAGNTAGHGPPLSGHLPPYPQDHLLGWSHHHSWGALPHSKRTEARNSTWTARENTASRVPQHGHTGIHLFSTCPILTAPKEAFMFSEDSFYQIIFLVNGSNLLLLAWLVILLLLNIECFEYVATLEVRVSFLCLL